LLTIVVDSSEAGLVTGLFSWCTLQFMLDRSGAGRQGALCGVFVMRQSRIREVLIPVGPLSVVVVSVSNVTELLMRSFEELCIVFQPTASDAIAGVALWRIVDLAAQFSVLLLLAAVISLPFC